MTEFTMGQAAKQLGLSKPTVSKHIREGRLSATRNADGSFSIDGAELARFTTVYKKGRVGRPTGPKPQVSSGSATELEVALLRERMEADKAAAEKRIGELEADREQLRQDLNDARDQLARITETVIARGRSAWWQKLLGKG